MDDATSGPPLQPWAAAVDAELLRYPSPHDITQSQFQAACDEVIAAHPSADPGQVEHRFYAGLTQAAHPTAAPLPLPLRAKRRPQGAHFRRDDLRATAVLEQAIAAMEAWLAGVDWQDSEQALVATTVIALLRMDVAPSTRALEAWLATPWRELVWQEGDVTFPTRQRLDPLTFLALHGWRTRVQPSADEPLGAAWMAARALPCPEPRTDEVIARQYKAAAQALAVRCGAVLAPWFPPVANPLRAVQGWLLAWRRVHWSPLLNTLSQPDASQPLAGHSMRRWDVGKAPPVSGEATQTEPTRLAFVPDGGGVNDGWLSPLQADRALAQLASSWRGGKHGVPTSARQAVAMVQACRGKHAWGYLEQLLLDWIESKLTGDSPLRASSAVRYLQGLRKLVTAQGRTPLVTRESATGKLRANIDHWDIALQRLAIECTDIHALGHVAQFFHSLLDVLPELDEVDLEALEVLREACQPAAHVVGPSEFEAAMAPLWNSGDSDSRRSAMAAALAFYLGPRHQEVLKLLAADLLDLDAGLLQIRPHRRRRLKTRNASRRIVVRPWLPAHWWQRLRDQARLLQQAAGAYLLAQPHAPAVPPADSLTDLAVACLRASTGDGRLTFHSLRHSFFTWNYLRVAVFDRPDLRAYPAAIMAEPALAPQAISEWMQAWRPAGGLPYDGSMVHELARMAGHGSPSTSLRWYVHVADLIVRGNTTLSLPTPQRSTLWRLLGVTERAFKTLEGRAKRGEQARVGVSVTMWAIQASLAEVPAHPWPAPSTRSPVANPPLTPLAVPTALGELARPGAHIQDVARQLHVDVASLERLVANRDTMRPWRELHESHRALFECACKALRALEQMRTFPRAMAYWAHGNLQANTRLAWDDVSGLPALLEVVGRLLESVGQGTRLHVSLHPVHGKKTRPGTQRACRALLQRLAACGIRAATVEPGPPRVAFPSDAPAGRGWQGHRVVLRLGRDGTSGFATEWGLMAALDAACLLRRPSAR